MQAGNLDRVTIPIRCHADWDLMAGDDRVRYCTACEKRVYNLSALTRRQAEVLVAEHGGKLCARIYQRPDGSVLTQNCPEGIRGLTAKITRRAGAVLSAMLSVGALAAQSQATPASQIPEPGKSLVQIEAVPGDSVLTGTVNHTTGFAIRYAVVELTNAVTGQMVASTITVEDGRYRIGKLGPGTYAAKVISSGFKVTIVTSLRLQAHESTQLNVTLETDSAQSMGEVVIVKPRPATKKLALFLTRPFRKNR
jgi:hypothetical protein